MAKHKITATKLAEVLGDRPNTIGDLRSATYQPKLNGERIGAILDALNATADRSTLSPGEKIEYKDLVVAIQQPVED